LEARSEPSLRDELLRLSGLAQRASRAIEGALEEAVNELILEASQSQLAVARTPLLAYDKHVRAHLLRALVARVGPRPGRVGTRTALEFITNCSSGRGIDLAGGVVISREFDRLIIERRQGETAARDQLLTLADMGGGVGDVGIAGASWRVRWSPGAPEDGAEAREKFACFDPSELRFPLTVRSWRPGDRIRLAAGTRKLKKVFGDLRIARSERERYPLLVDGSGVLWIVGLLRGVRAEAVGEGEALSVWLRRGG
jgi:tRNA(Ile)-lysidine synthase